MTINKITITNTTIIWTFCPSSVVISICLVCREWQDLKPTIKLLPSGQHLCDTLCCPLITIYCPLKDLLVKSLTKIQHTNCLFFKRQSRNKIITKHEEEDKEEDQERELQNPGDILMFYRCFVSLKQQCHL